jgi:hypothetical protein
MLVVFLAMDDQCMCAIQSAAELCNLFSQCTPYIYIYTHVSCLAGMDYFGIQLYALYIYFSLYPDISS